MINRDLLLKIPLKPADIGVEGNLDDGFDYLQSRWDDTEKTIDGITK